MMEGITNPYLAMLIRLAEKEIPGFQVKFKNESWTSKVLGFLTWPFNKRYMQDFTTTRGKTVFFPSRKWMLDRQMVAAKVLAHELVHLWDRKHRNFITHECWYMFPQILALFSLLALFGGSWMHCLWFLCALLPLPAPGRMELEMRGYTMSMAMNYWRYDSIRPGTKEWVSKRFTGWEYYKMWPFKGDMIGHLREAEGWITMGLILDDRIFKKVHDVVRSIKDTSYLAKKRRKQ